MAEEKKLRTWWPVDWVDEVCPPPRHDPNEWLIDAGGHYWLGYALDADDVSEHEKRYFARALDVGDIVNFVCCDDLGFARIAVYPDGCSAFPAGDPDLKRATHFWLDGDTETLVHSLEQFVRQYLEIERDAGTPVAHRRLVDVRIACWSDPMPFKLRADADNFTRTGAVRCGLYALSMAEARQ